MIHTITATTNSSVKMLCTNCIYGDYWIDRHIFGQDRAGFDCSYPTIGSKFNREIDSKLVSDDEIAIDCPKYQLVDAMD